MGIELIHGFTMPRFHEKKPAARRTILEQYPDLQEIKEKNKLPNGIAIILDGNGRWAQERGLPTYEGHKAGAEAAKKLMRACVDLGIDLSLWILSPDNISKRSPKEVRGIYKIFQENIGLLVKTAQEENGKIIHVGEKDGLPGDIRLALRRAQWRTRNNTGQKLGLAINYDQEKFVKGLANGTNPKEQSEITPADIVIRTGKVQRLSGFGLPFVGNNSELYFPDVYLPDLNEQHIHDILVDFANRTRTLGGRNGNNHTS